MPLLVDAYNVIHAVGILPPELAGIDVADLIRLIQGSRYDQEDVRLICDGTPAPDAPARRHGRLIIHYAGAGQSADDVIVDIVNTSTTPRRLTVVTSDAAIIREVRKRRAPTIAAAAFLDHLATDAHRAAARPAPQPPPPESRAALTDAQVQHWMRRFGLDGTETPIDTSDLELPEHLRPTPPPPPVGRPHDHRASAAASAADDEPRPPSMPELPPDIIAEAEAILRELEPPREADES
ncbi:MAG: NYN domain-containing protein [Phycisphaerales bacterium]|nr:NYN domain-containing protein [Phycisphaerales bacterium]